MKALTVQQPWAWAIVHGGKDVENRTRAWSYRGPLAIHAGGRESRRGVESPLVQRAMGDAMRADRMPIDLVFGAIIGVVDLVDVHLAQPSDMLDRPGTQACCGSPWGEVAYQGERNLVHLELANPRPLEVPIPCKGRLGLWTPPAEVLEQLQAVTR